MDLRYDSENGRDPLLDNNEDTISEESMSSISSVYSYKNILVGEHSIGADQIYSTLYFQV